LFATVNGMEACFTACSARQDCWGCANQCRGKDGCIWHAVRSCGHREKMLDPTKYGIIWKAMRPEPLPEPDVWINCSNVALIAQLVMSVLLVLTYCTHPRHWLYFVLRVPMKRVFFRTVKLLTTAPQKQVSQVVLLAHSRAGVAFAMLRLVIGVIQMYPMLSPLFMWRPSAIAAQDCMQHTHAHSS